MLTLYDCSTLWPSASVPGLGDQCEGRSTRPPETTARAEAVGERRQEQGEGQQK